MIAVVTPSPVMGRNSTKSASEGTVSTAAVMRSEPSRMPVAHQSKLNRRGLGSPVETIRPRVMLIAEPTPTQMSTNRKCCSVRAKIWALFAAKYWKTFTTLVPFWSEGRVDWTGGGGVGGSGGAGPHRGGRRG